MSHKKQLQSRWLTFYDSLRISFFLLSSNSCIQLLRHQKVFELFFHFIPSHAGVPKINRCWGSKILSLVSQVFVPFLLLLLRIHNVHVLLGFHFWIIHILLTLLPLLFCQCLRAWINHQSYQKHDIIYPIYL